MKARLIWTSDTTAILHTDTLISLELRNAIIQCDGVESPMPCVRTHRYSMDIESGLLFTFCYVTRAIHDALAIHAHRIDHDLDMTVSYPDGKTEVVQ